MIRNRFMRNRLLTRRRILSASNKYQPGEFGYWWTVELGNEDIEGKAYRGNIECYDCDLTSLKGAPKYVDGDFWCSNNHLTSLEGAPEEVGRNFICAYNEITSLKGAPEYVGWRFDCAYCNNLTSLESAPRKIGERFYCDGCPNLSKREIISLRDYCDIKGKIKSNYGLF